MEKSSRTEGLLPRIALWAFASLCLLLPFFAQASLALRASITSGKNVSEAVVSTSLNHSVRESNEKDSVQVLRDVVTAGIPKMPSSLVSKLLAAEVRPECNKALLRTVRALQSLEPWVLRLIDATGKYPTGFLEASHVDMGAFDECLETLVRDRNGTVVSRGQYCNLHVYAKSSAALQAMMNYMSDAMHPSLVYFTKHGSSAEDPLARLALCYIDECNQGDLQALVNAVSVPFFRFEVSNCVTAEPRPWNNTQIAIAVFAGVLLLVIIVSTLADHFVEQQSEWRKNHGLAFQVVKAFSAKSNTELLLYVPSEEQAEQHSLLFLHGIRCLATVHIVAGHLNVMITDSLTRVLSLFAGSTKWQNMLIPAAFNSVDTFFFLSPPSVRALMCGLISSGFFLCHIICKQKANSAVVFIIAVIKRLIRMCVPLFFVIMWFYLLPRFVDGPDTEEFFQRFNGELSKHWWMFLLQIRNFYEFDLQDILVYPWYLSADFQLFLVSLVILLTFRRQKRVALAAFGALSLIGCAIATWTVARLDLPPFLIMPFPDLPRLLSTFSDYYAKPFYHAVCYFSGCMTCLVVADFRERKISKTLQLAGWCTSVSCGLICVFVKLPWYLRENPTKKSIEILLAFFDRIMWSISLAWIMLVCSTGRGGPVNKFLSWNAFVPLSKLSYGVYLIHLPFFKLMMHSSRERVHFSEFNRATVGLGVLVWCFVLSYFAFIACEAPTAVLDRLAFDLLTGRASNSREKRQEQPDGEHSKTVNGRGEGNEASQL